MIHLFRQRTNTRHTVLRFDVRDLQVDASFLPSVICKVETSKIK